VFRKNVVLAVKVMGRKRCPEDTEPEDEPEGEMDNFQDLQLGSTTPVVRHEVNSPRLPLT
jgi:hypothetical protein